MWRYELKDRGFVKLTLKNHYYILQITACLRNVSLHAIQSKLTIALIAGVKRGSDYHSAAARKA